MPESANSTLTKNLPVIDDYDFYAALKAASTYFARPNEPTTSDEAAV
jgi:hypothetical protein